MARHDGVTTTTGWYNGWWYPGWSVVNGWIDFITFIIDSAPVSFVCFLLCVSIVFMYKELV